MTNENINKVLTSLLIEFPNKSASYILTKLHERHKDFPIKNRAIRYRLNNLKRSPKVSTAMRESMREGITELEETNTGDQAKFTGKINSKQTDRAKVLEEFLAQAEVDLTVWKVKSYKLRAWDVTMKVKYDLNNPGRTYTNYYIAVDLEKIGRDEFNEQEFMEFTESMMEKYSGKVPKYTYQKNTDKVGENLLMLSINDLHLGRFVWAEECGVGSTTEIAGRNAIAGVNELLEDASTTNIDRILYYIGHDYLTVDFARHVPMTSNGTPQEVDMRWQQLFQFGEELQIQIINYLSTIAPVDVQIIPGNHDYQVSFYLGRVLKAVYANNENVNIDVSAPVRKYYRWGDCNLMAAHGKYEKPQDIHAIMMAEDRANMGDTKYWYALFGHQHHFVEKNIKAVERVKGSPKLGTIKNVNEDYKGLTITYLPNLSHRDDYEVERAYVGTIRSAMAMVFNTVKGRKTIFQHNL